MLLRQWYYVSSRPLEKLFAYRKGSRIDVQSMAQPFATHVGKSLIDNYISAQQQHVRVQM